MTALLILYVLAAIVVFVFAALWFRRTALGLSGAIIVALLWPLVAMPVVAAIAIDVFFAIARRRR